MEKKMEEEKNNKGITIIVLVVTILVLLILARYKFSSSIWTKWNNSPSKRSKNANRNGDCKRKTRYISLTEVMTQQEV